MVRELGERRWFDPLTWNFFILLLLLALGFFSYFIIVWFLFVTLFVTKKLLLRRLPKAEGMSLFRALMP